MGDDAPAGCARPGCDRRAPRASAPGAAPVPASAPAPLSETGSPRPADAPAPAITGEGPAAGAGRTLGRYRVFRRIGAGGFARVYRAEDPELDLAVAIKLLRPELAADAELVDRFRREAMTAARLRHPNVVTVISVGRTEESFDGAATGTPYLVMDFHPGSLSARLAVEPVLAEGEVARIGAEVARGLAYAHRHGIVHRDVKPENVLFAADGRAVVTDFGIARAMEGFSPIGTVGPTLDRVLGTPSYFSPEQARGLPLDGRSDVYGLGVTLFQLATGSLPYVGDDWYAIMRQHVDAPIPSVRERAPAVSPAFDAVVQRCLAKAPEERWASADELADALEALASPDGVTVAVSPLRTSTAGTPPLPAETRRTARGAGWALGAGALALAATAIALVASQHGATRTRERLASGAEGGRAAAESAAAVRDSLPVAGGPGALPTVASLELAAPGSAAISLDGASVGRGGWISDSVTPGTHTVRAVLAAALPGCPTAAQELQVALLPGERKVVRLQPVGCGRLQFGEVNPLPARFTIRALNGRYERSGVLPLAVPLVLPEGAYALRVGGAAGCAEFEDRVTVAGNGAIQRVPRIRLLCG